MQLLLMLLLPMRMIKNVATADVTSAYEDDKNATTADVTPAYEDCKKRSYCLCYSCL